MKNLEFSRRKWLQTASFMGLTALGTKNAQSIQATDQSKGSYKTYFGDLHNHNAIGYAQGSLRRSFEIARNHLDFFSFTPHAHWHDIGTYSKGIEKKWIDGFAVTRQHWPKVLKYMREFDDPDTFVTIPGYEWHSTSLGDYHILFPDLDAELALFDDLKKFQQFAYERGCIMIPHHPANPAGHRGANPKYWNPKVSPVLEIYSEWGNAEHDRAPYPYKRHTEGGRWTGNTLQHILSLGHRMGVLASTDDHLGYPGAYREGLAAIKATHLSRPALFDAIQNRRTYAVSGDRIDLDFWLNNRMMGQELGYTRNREISVQVTGWNQIERVEVLKNNRVIHRDFPMDRDTSAKSWRHPVLIRFDYGWGPWPALGWDRIADWDVEMIVENGHLLDIHPCFSSGPLDESRRDRIVSWDSKHARLESFTSLKQQIDDYSQKALILKLQADPETEITFRFNKPTQFKKRIKLKDLVTNNIPIFTAPFPWESAMVQRVVFNDHYSTSFDLLDKDNGLKDNWYYIRVVQANDQMAWSSPVWVDAKE